MSRSGKRKLDNRKLGNRDRLRGTLLSLTTALAGLGAALPPQAQASETPAAAPAAAAAEPQASVELGRKTYAVSCTRCHGINLVTSSSAHFDLRTFPANDKARFERSVMQGVRAMPAWGGTLKPVQLESLWLYIGSVNGWPAVETTAATPAATR